MNTYSLISIGVPLMVGWYLGYRTPKGSYSLTKRAHLPRDYLLGLNFLLNEETDKAVDVFIKMLEVDSDTIETHLAVGKLFRRRGEVDRALRIHQNLIARPQLDKVTKEQALFELGQDYLSAGMLDRAEKIFTELLSIQAHHVAALRALMDIYQQEKAWQKAIQVAYKVEQVGHTSLQTEIAHYYCELAEAAVSQQNYPAAEKYLNRALDADRHCVRASLIQAKMEMARGDFKTALRSLKYIKAQNPDFLSEAIELLAECYEKLQEEKGLITYLRKLLVEYPLVPIVLTLAERIRKWRGDQVASGFVAEYVRRHPSLQGLQLFINMYISNTEGRIKEDLLLLQGLISKLLANKPDYQCISCGFSGKILFWSCPSCKQWASIKPLHCIEKIA